MSQLPLEGVRILEPAQLLAAPFATSLLGDFGAEVIKFEVPGEGDRLRTNPPHYKGESLWWKHTSRNKKSVTLDFRQPKGQELFKRMVPKADVVLENFRTGVMEKWGLGWEELRRIHPKLVMVRQTGFGQTGPYAERPAFGMIVEAYAGLTGSLGYSDTPPVTSGIGDHLAGLSIAYAIMIALYHRDVHDGPGQLIDNAASETILRLVGEWTIPGAALGLPPRPKRPSDTPSMVGPWGDFRAVGSFLTQDDKWCNFTPSTRPIWERLVKAMGREDFLDEGSYERGTEAWQARAEEILAAVRGWFAGHTRDEVVRLAEQFEVPVGPVYDAEDILRDPHFQARETVVDVPDPDLGTLKMVAPLPRFSETPGRISHAGPSIGQHTDQVYREWLGLSDDDLTTLRREKVI